MNRVQLCLIVGLIFSFFSTDVVSVELRACNKDSIVVGIYEDQILENMNGYLFLGKLHTRHKEYDRFVSNMIAKLSARYSLKLCYLKGGEEPAVTVAFINRPLTVWISRPSREKLVESNFREYAKLIKKKYPDMLVGNLLETPESVLPGDINYLCRISSPWIEIGSYIDGNIKRVHAVINWSVRQDIPDQFSLVSRNVNNSKFSRTIFSDTYRSYVNQFQKDWFRLKSEKQYQNNIKGIPVDLIWLFESSPDITATDSAFPNIGMIIDHSHNVYPSLISNLFDTCYKAVEYKQIVIDSIHDASNFVNIKKYKIERPVFSRFSK